MWLHYPNIISSNLPNAILLHWYLSKKSRKDFFHGVLLQHIPSCSQSPWFSWGTSITLMFVIGTTQQSTNNPRGSIVESIDDNFLLLVMERPTWKAGLLDLKLYNKEGLVADTKAVATFITVIMEFHIAWGRNSPELQESQLQSLQGPSLKNFTWTCFAGSRILEYSTITSSRLKTSAWPARNSCQNPNIGRRYKGGEKRDRSPGSITVMLSECVKMQQGRPRPIWN